MLASLAKTSADQLASFNAFDWLLVAVLVWSVVVAFFRGLVRELFGLAGVILGILLASWNYAALATWLDRGLNGLLKGWTHTFVLSEVSAFVLIAVVVMCVCTLFGKLARGSAHTLGLGLLDRLAGAGFGLFRGGLIGLGIVMAATAFLPPQSLLASSRAAPYFLAAAREVCFVVPQDLQQRITGGITHIGHIAQR